MPPIGWLGWQGSQSDSHRHESGEVSSQLSVGSWQQVTIPVHRSRAAEGDQTERAKTSESQPAKARHQRREQGGRDRTKYNETHGSVNLFSHERIIRRSKPLRLASFSRAYAYFVRARVRPPLPIPGDFRKPHFARTRHDRQLHRSI
jgi:hypothetical protein